VVEDNSVNVEVALAMLENIGCAADSACNGLEALDALERSHYDVVLMDCEMPEMDGYRATREIRRRERDEASQRRTPIIALTANATEGSRERCLESGMDDYLSKPFSRDRLAAALLRWLDGSRREAPKAGDGTAVEPDKRSTAVDPSALDELRRLGEATGSDVASRAVRAFLDISVQYAASIRDAIESSDANAAAQAAHALKSSSGQLGALRLSELCGDLEARARAGESHSLASSIAKLDTELEIVRELLATETVGD
jgi:CheY-like chemotaxis protein/HPt (histidine-containing phosphotransfer) domain-containing protein